LRHTGADASDGFAGGVGDAFLSIFMLYAFQSSQGPRDTNFSQSVCCTFAYILIGVTQCGN
jgi:hypothetical protein